MTTTTKILVKTACIALLAFSFASCSKEQPTTVPESGTIEYDILYSGSIRDMGVIGHMLPSKLYGTYNHDGVRMSAQAGLGIVKIDIIGTINDSYMTININGKKMLVPFESLFLDQDREKYNKEVKTVEEDKIEIVAGWESKVVKTTAPSPWGMMKIETYYVPVPSLNRVIKGSPVPNVPGLITAMKMSIEDSNIILMLSDVQAKEISNDVFERPANYHLATRSEVDSIILANIQSEK